MVRIEVKCPLRFTLRGEVRNFLPKHIYEVSDAIAAHPFIKRYLLKSEMIVAKAPEKIVEDEPKAVETPTQTEKPKRVNKRKTDSKSKKKTKEES